MEEFWRKTDERNAQTTKARKPIDYAKLEIPFLREPPYIKITFKEGAMVQEKRCKNYLCIDLGENRILPNAPKNIWADWKCSCMVKDLWDIWLGVGRYSRLRICNSWDGNT